MKQFGTLNKYDVLVLKTQNMRLWYSAKEMFSQSMKTSVLSVAFLVKQDTQIIIVLIFLDQTSSRLK